MICMVWVWLFVMLIFVVCFCEFEVDFKMVMVLVLWFILVNLLFLVLVGGKFGFCLFVFELDSIGVLFGIWCFVGEVIVIFVDGLFLVCCD